GAPRFGAKSLARGSMKRRHRPGALALKEIRRLQKSTHNLIPRLPLQRVFREVVRELYPNGEYRFTQECCEALQEFIEKYFKAAEIHLVEAFSNANTCAVHAKRVTVKPDDIHL
ncbi:core histone H2A/H2B/H3/H4, partial [Teladorsagia circumcincta]